MECLGMHRGVIASSHLIQIDSKSAPSKEERTLANIGLLALIW